MGEVGQEALDRAIDGETELVLLYQPIHDTRSGAIYGAEALLRQRRQDGEIRDASIVTEAAEDGDSPDLYALDRMIIKQAYSDAARWQSDFPEVRLNVNLSPREFQEGNVLDRLTGLLTACAIDTAKVNLEITETTYIERPKETMKVLEAIDALGLNIWLDDFGTGHSSLTHLQHFRVLDGIKLPAAFIKNVPKDDRCMTIVRSLIALAHELDLQVIAEGIEHEEQLTFLRDLDCELVQGFLFHRPMTVDAFQATLAGRASSGQ